MTTPGSGPNDAFDPFETRLANRVARHAEGGIRPIDAGAIAHQAAMAGGRQGRGAGLGALARVGWLLAGAALAVGAIGGVAWAGSHGLLGVTAPTDQPSFVAVVPTESVPSAPAATTLAPTLAPTPTAAPTKAPTVACAVADLSAKVTGWAGAAGNRVGTVVLTSHSATDCKLATLQRPQLVDANDVVLIDGDAPSHPTTTLLTPGESVTTMVDDANYCGSAPTAPVTVAFVFAGGDQLVAEAKSTSDMSGLPDCLGPGGPGLMTMHPWAP
jgi:hypothetical protein